MPLGLQGKDDIVYLNLHEKAHSPHGLIAGTTGSGKSEIIPLYLIDEMEARTIVGRTELEIEEILGHGLIKLEAPVLFQKALPAEGAGALEIIDHIQQESKEMDAY